MRQPILTPLLAYFLTWVCYAHRTCAAGPGSIEFRGDIRVPQIAFAIDEIFQATLVTETPHPRLVVEFRIDEKSLPRQAYKIERIESPAGFRVTGGDPPGAMYGGLDIAEAIRINALGELAEGERRPYIERRGIKFNIPLDVRTPSYSDNGDSFQANIPEVWSTAFWHEFLDEMARHRYNVLTLWNLHPFPSIVRVPEFPDVALNDVWRTRLRLDDTFSHSGSDMVRPEMLRDVEIVRRMTIDEKIAFWRHVMEYAHDRGIEVYWFTWNIFVWGTDGKYGITADRDNPVTIQYFRASVRELVRTYPLLAGIGITAGENMGRDDKRLTKEQWLWQTYGEGIRDALADQPGRSFRLIHRFHMTNLSEILKEFHEARDILEFSFKYSIAHMYSIPDPPFIKTALQHMPPGMKTWLTVRNDDIYSFRWGDPDYAREYILNMPGSNRLAGFYMGPDGYCWGREAIDIDGEVPRQLVMKKQWYSFLLWGRLSYDPQISNDHFRKILAAKFPEVPSEKLFTAWAAASRVFPLITRFFWGDIDLRWFPEACMRYPAPRGFYTVKDFILGETMPGSGVLNIREWLNHKDHPEKVAVGPLEIASDLESNAQKTLTLLADLKSPNITGRELQRTLGDLEAMAYLGKYYAEKIRGAVKLAEFDRDGKAEHQQAAVAHLQNALTNWQRYAEITRSQYKPQLLNRIGYVDLNEVTAYVEQDIQIAQQWKPGALREAAPARRQGDVPFRP
ncbi:hypothetical protein [Thermogutta sp.]|uniref:hypothetical protein n=1 Tax=Thermogutta sp. TaxID=1962930 RepID=UPI003C7B6031